MKILCPTDLSEPALNAMEYASKLAQSLKATLTLVNVQNMYIGEGLTMFSGGERESVKEARSTSEILEEYCHDIGLTFSISCNHLVIPTMGSFANAIADEGSNYDLIVVGTNGTDNLFQFYFGSNSFHVARKVKSPVLIIPEQCRFKQFQEICFASDYTTKEESLFRHVNLLFKSFDARLSVIHLSEKETELSKVVYQSFCNSMEENLGYPENLSFKRLICKEPISGLKHIIDSCKFDLLVLTLQNHNVIYKLFHKNLSKDIVAYTTVPLMIVHN